MADMAKLNLIKRGETWYIRKRVPSRYAAIDPRGIIRVCLFTDSQDIAHMKAPKIWGEMIEAWELKLDGKDAAGEKRLAAARNLAHKRGYQYLDSSSVAALPIGEILARVEAVPDPAGRIDMAEADAMLGLPEKPVSP